MVPQTGRSPSDPWLPRYHRTHVQASTQKVLRTTAIGTTAVISAHVQTSNSYGTTRSLHFTARVKHAAYCIEKKKQKTKWNLPLWDQEIMIKYIFCLDYMERRTGPQYEFPWELVRLLKLVKSSKSIQPLD